MMRIGLVEQGRNPLLLFYSPFRTYVHIKNLDVLRLNKAKIVLDFSVKYDIISL